jgi:hypothetical protein
MRTLITKVWGKVRLTVIIILSIAIGISWTISYQEFKIIRCEASETWTHVQSIQEQRREIKSTEDDGRVVGELRSGTPATQQVSPEAASEDRIAEALPSDSVEELIYNYFKDDYQVAKAVFTAESGLKETAQEWNCRYGKESRACAPGDRGNAWSVDCGIAQINVLGKVCPKELFDPSHNLQIARQKYETRRWQPWSQFKNGNYKKYLALN